MSSLGQREVSLSCPWMGFKVLPTPNSIILSQQELCYSQVHKYHFEPEFWGDLEGKKREFATFKLVFASPAALVLKPSPFKPIPKDFLGEKSNTPMPAGEGREFTEVLDGVNQGS